MSVEAEEGERSCAGFILQSWTCLKCYSRIKKNSKPEQTSYLNRYCNLQLKISIFDKVAYTVIASTTGLGDTCKNLLTRAASFSFPIEWGDDDFFSCSELSTNYSAFCSLAKNALDLLYWRNQEFIAARGKECARISFRKGCISLSSGKVFGIVFIIVLP